MSGPIDFDSIKEAALRNGRAFVQQLIVRTGQATPSSCSPTRPPIRASAFLASAPAQQPKPNRRRPAKTRLTISTTRSISDEQTMSTRREMEALLVSYFGHDARGDDGSWIAAVDFEFDISRDDDDETPIEVVYVDLTDLARFITNHTERS